MLKLDALQKYENALLENFSPSVLRELKRSNWNGLLREIDRLYATMYHEWDALQKDVVDIEDAVRSLTWTVNPYTRDGEEPGEYAKKVAQVVQEALWAKAPLEPGSVGHTFQQLLGALVHHRFRGFNVHQIVWKKAGNLIFPARYIQLPPQFMVWETKAGHPDRLLLVEDGASADGIPFPPHKYIVALNTSGPDHPLYNATFYSLVNWFVAFKFGLGWFMEYAQKYGMPKQVLHYANEKERQQLIDDLSDETVLNTILLKSGGSGEYDIKFPTGGSASLPQAVLLQKAEEACHKAILGQTLTSDTSAHGGSLAQAKVHAGVQADVVMKIAESVADILNQQLVPAILQANFGRVQGLPIPELRCKLPQAVASIERAQFLKTALEIPGMKVTKTEAYEYLNLTQPSDTDEVFEAKDPNAMGGGPGGDGGGFPGMGAGFPGGGKEAELPDAGAKDEVVTSAKAPVAPRDRNEAIKAWLSPLKKKLEEARSSGASLSDIREQISAWKPDTRALAGALADNISNGLLGSTRGNEGTANGNTEEVAAENPYGCNQHGHGWVDACPYGGGGSNGMAGKSALQIAGGAENVNPDPDDDEEEKKKKEEEEKAAAEAKAKEEAEKKAKEEAERKAREEEEKKKAFDDETEALKKEIKGDALQKLQPYKDELQAIIDQYKGQDLSAQQKTALAYLEKIKEGLDEKMLQNLQWQDWQIEHRAEVNEFDKEKLKNHADFYIKHVLDKARKEADKRIAKLQPQSVGGRKPVADIEKALESLPGKYEAQKKCAKAASAGTGSLEKLWNEKYTKEQQRVLYLYTDGSYEHINDTFREGKEDETTRTIKSCFAKAKLGIDLTVSRGESLAGFGEYDKKLGKIAEQSRVGDLDMRDAARLAYEHIKARLEKGEEVIRKASAVTSTSVRESRAFDNGVMRLIHLPKGSKALCVAPISYYEDFRFDVGQKIDSKQYKNATNVAGEKEVIIAPGSKFRTISVQLGRDGELYIEEELILE